ncbi:MAG: hypothetical protein FWD17_09220 [Polyangiaceae bacterium]|nr:hypothetical protein [Polyangiaceae bacterium]
MSAASVNLAGKPSRFGGAVAGVAGIFVLLVGLAIALMVGALVSWLTSIGVALAVGGPIAAVAGVVGIVLMLSGRRLERMGKDHEQSTMDQALLALVEEREAISGADAALALGLRPHQADALLVSLAKREPERISVEVDDKGVLWYRAAPGYARVAAHPSVRVAEGDEKNVRVGGEAPIEPEAEPRADANANANRFRR